MKRRSLALLVALGLAFTVVARAQAPQALFGTWRLNTSKSTFSPGPPPKSMTVTYSAAGFGMRIIVDVVPGTGQAQHWEMTPMYDGKDHKVTGNPEAETISIRRISDTKGESTFKKAGKPLLVNVRTLSPDGKPRHDVAVFEK